MSQTPDWEDVWVPWLRARRDQAFCFAERAKTCPLEVSLRAYDPDDAVCTLLSETDSAESLFDPIVEALEHCCNKEWRSIRLDLRLNQSTPLSFIFAGIITAIPRNSPATLALDIACSNGAPLSDETWAAIGGKLDIRRGGFGPSLTAKMTQADFNRIDANWVCLTTLAIGPPDDRTKFTARHALNVLSLTPNLANLSIEFSIAAAFERDIPTRLVQLPRLKSLSIIAILPRKGFSSALVLPSLTHLYAEKIRYRVPPEDETSSTVLDLVQRFGKQLVDVGLHYQCFTQSALISTIGHLPNVEVLRLTTDDDAINSYTLLEQGSNLNIEPAAMLEPILSKFVPRIGTSPVAPGEEYFCPRLKELTFGVCKLTDKVRDDILLLIQERRSVNNKSGLITGLQHLTVGFDGASGVDGLHGELEKRGLDPRGLKFKARDRVT